MKNQNIIIGLLAILVLGSIWWFTSQDQSSSQQETTALEITTTESKSALVATSNSYDFGEIDIFAGDVSTTYTLENTGTEPVTITSATTSCMCTEGEIGGITFGMHESDLDSLVIPAGATEVLTATYDPLAHGPNGTGPVTRVLTLKTDSTETPQVELRLSANVTKN